MGRRMNLNSPPAKFSDFKIKNQESWRTFDKVRDCGNSNVKVLTMGRSSGRCYHLNRQPEKCVRLYYAKFKHKR